MVSTSSLKNLQKPEKCPFQTFKMFVFELKVYYCTTAFFLVFFAYVLHVVRVILFNLFFHGAITPVMEAIVALSIFCACTYKLVITTMYFLIYLVSPMLLTFLLTLDISLSTGAFSILILFTICTVFFL